MKPLWDRPSSTNPYFDPCAKCDGTGRVSVEWPDGDQEDSVRECRWCSGYGVVYSAMAEPVIELMLFHDRIRGGMA